MRDTDFFACVKQTSLAACQKNIKRLSKEQMRKLQVPQYGDSD
jgi:hypothetical protein